MSKHILYPVIALFFLISCSPAEQKEGSKISPDYSGKLTPEEKEGGRLTPELLWKFGRVGSSSISPDGSTVIYTVTRYDARTNGRLTSVFSIPAKGGRPENLTRDEGSASQPQWHPSGERIGYLSDRSGSMQLWEMNPNGSNKKRLSDIPGGLNSFGYSPGGNMIYFTRRVKLDPTPVELHPDLPLAEARVVDDLMYRHWDNWHDYAYSHIFVAEINAGMVTNPVDIMEGEPYDAPMAPYFENKEIAWSPDGKLLAYTCKKLVGKDYAVSTNSDIYLYSLETGETENITGGMPGYDKYPVFSPDGKRIAFQSMKTPGYEADKERLMIINLESGEMMDATANLDQNAKNFAWSPDGKLLWFISGIHATYQVYYISLESMSVKQITSGVHDYTAFSIQGQTMIGEKMSMSMATELFSINMDTGEEMQLTSTNRQIYDVIEMGKVEERWIKTTDNKEMLVWVIYPPGFDSTKTYPALLYCQGGPQSAVSQFFSFRWNFQMMAARDYIVVAPNRRGLPTFGQEWNAQVSGDYGGQNMLDYLTAIDVLAKEPYVDANRLGAVGASYGGFSVFWLAGNHQNRFKAFISHCGIFNLESMYASTEETFFVNHEMEGPYWQTPRPRSYQFSPHLFVQNWNTPILIITGARDFRIPYTESLQAFNAAKLRGVPARLLYFPDETHFVTQPQNSILWQREFFRWLDTWLK